MRRRGVGMGGIGGYTLGDRYVTPDRRLSQMLMQQGSKGGPSNSWQETLGRIAQQLSGAYIGKLDQDNQDVANRAFTRVQPDSYTRQPTISEADARGSSQVGDILEQYNDQNLMEGPMAQENVRRIGGQQDRITQAENAINEANNPETPFNDPADRARRIEFENQSIANANDQIDQFGDQFNNQMAIGTSRKDQFVNDEIARQREASEQDVLDKKMPQSEYSMQNLRKLTDNPYAQRLLQGLMMQSADRDYASGLAETQREFAQEDATTDFGRKKELANLQINNIKTKEQRNFLQAQNNPQFKEFLVATGAENTPNAVKEYEYYTTLKTPEEKQNFMNIKRASQSRNLGDRVESVDPTNPSGPALSISKKGVPPQQTPAHKAAVKTSETLAKSQSEAKFDLPKLEEKANYAVTLIDQALEHPGLSGVVGAPNVFTLGGLIPGTDEANFRALQKQLEGGAFLDAFDSLKGGGHITEIEGQKATESRARMSTSQSEVEFKKSLNEYKALMEIGINRARKQASGLAKGRRSGEPNEGVPSDLPEASSSTGKTLMDKDTGFKWKSDGTNWKRVQ